MNNLQRSIKDRCPVSVVIPSHNRAVLLGRAIDSVLCQTMQCSEIIVIDDGSIDNTTEVLAEKSLQQEIDLRVFDQANKGPAAARNLGIKKARHPFIAFLDSDDHWQRKKLEIQYLALVENPTYLISHTQEKWLRRGIHLNQKKHHHPRHGKIFDHCLQLCAVGVSTVMVNTALFDKVGFFDESLSCCEDYDLWLRISCRYQFLLVKKTLTVKEGGRQDQVSFLHRRGMDRMRIYSIQKILDLDILTRSQYFLAFKELKKKALIFGNGCIKHKKPELGHRYLDLISIYRKKCLHKWSQ